MSIDGETACASARVSWYCIARHDEWVRVVLEDKQKRIMCAVTPFSPSEENGSAICLGNISSKCLFILLAPQYEF